MVQWQRRIKGGGQLSPFGILKRGREKGKRRESMSAMSAKDVEFTNNIS